MPYPPEKFKLTDISAIALALSAILWTVLFILAVICVICGFFEDSNRLNEQKWSGYSPIEVYQIFDKETGVYYAVTSEGGICPMYTIESELKLVDEGNEYVTHKNLGEPDAQE